MRPVDLLLSHFNSTVFNFAISFKHFSLIFLNYRNCNDIACIMILCVHVTRDQGMRGKDIHKRVFKYEAFFSYFDATAKICACFTLISLLMSDNSKNLPGK